MALVDLEDFSLAGLENRIQQLALVQGIHFIG